MNTVQLNYLKSNMASLEMSTDLTVLASGVRAKFGGRCSSLLSHQTVEFFPDSCRWGDCEMMNTWAHIIINPTDPPGLSITGYRYNGEHESPAPYTSPRYGDNIVCESVDVVIPALLLAALKEEMRLVSYELPRSGVVRVRFWMPQLKCYADDGSPVFVEVETGEEE